MESTHYSIIPFLFLAALVGILLTVRQAEPAEDRGPHQAKCSESAAPRGLRQMIYGAPFQHKTDDSVNQEAWEAGGGEDGGGSG